MKQNIRQAMNVHKGYIPVHDQIDRFTLFISFSFSIIMPIANEVLGI
jgi:hypothetical protein